MKPYKDLGVYKTRKNKLPIVVTSYKHGNIYYANQHTGVYTRNVMSGWNFQANRNWILKNRKMNIEEGLMWVQLEYYVRRNR